ncbi:hypothetical protein GJAV_G00141600 [Gymnothorax javanicus]|nr:hypothetical protein GJAV_G00141600 [Gymnothorax javanicus]
MPDPGVSKMPLLLRCPWSCRSLSGLGSVAGLPLPSVPGTLHGHGRRPLQRQLSADAAVVMGNAKNRCSNSMSACMKNTRVFSLGVPETRSPENPEKGSPLGNGSGGGGGGVGAGTGSQHLEVHPDYHCSEHRHSFPALYYEGGADSPAQKASFLKPLSRSSKRDAGSYSQLSPRHHNHSGYSSSPEYSSESTLRIWERFRPYKKSPREEASYIAAAHALRKKRDEDEEDTVAVAERTVTLVTLC